MYATIILDHPYGLASSDNVPHNRSYTAALAKAAKDGLEKAAYTVDLIDLQAENFSPLMTRENLLAWRTKPYVDEISNDYMARLKASDLIVFAFPVWWEAMPATTKGFIDKVFAKGQADETRKVLSFHTKIRVLATLGTPVWYYKWHYKNPIGNIFKKGLFNKIGLKDVKVHYFNAEDWSDAKRAERLKNIEKYLN